MRFSYPARYDFFLNTELSYQERLESIKVEKLATPLFDAHARQLIASNEELSVRGIKAIQASSEQISGAIGQQTEILEGALGAISDGVDELNSSLQDIAVTLSAGFSEIILQQGRMADSLEQLVKLAANPSLTWALEQFNLARDEVRRGLYEEALESIQRAINGFGSNIGYKTEFRFHGLLGMLRLGEFKDSPVEMIDVAKAQADFAYAAKLCQKDKSVDCVRMHQLASRAAYLNGNVESALEHSKSAYSIVREKSDLTPGFHRDLYLEAAFNVVRMEISRSVTRNEKIPAWSSEALKIIFANDMKFAVAASSDPIISGIPVLSSSIEAAVAAMNDERAAAGTLMDENYLNFSNTLAEKLGKIRNLTLGEKGAPSFDFSNETSFMALPQQSYGQTLTSAFEGKKAFSGRGDLFKEKHKEISEKVSRALAFESNLMSDKKIVAASDSWGGNMWKTYFLGVIGFASLAFILNRLVSNDTLLMGIGVFFMVGFMAAIALAILVPIIYFFGNFAVKASSDDRSANKIELDKLKVAAKSISEYGNFSLPLSQGKLSPEHLVAVLG